jgi:hypothetical protein
VDAEALGAALASLFTDRYGRDLPASAVRVKQLGDRTWIEVADEFEAPRMRQPREATLRAIAQLTGWPAVVLREAVEGAGDTCLMGQRAGYLFSTGERMDGCSVGGLGASAAQTGQAPGMPLPAAPDLKTES